MGGNEENYVAEAFKTNWIAPLGPNLTGFEDSIEEFLGESKRVAVLSSGTAAIHLGLKILGVGAGDEVICQSFTFSASANPITYLGAIPIFVDSENSTWNLDPELLEDCIKERIKSGKTPKAIIAVDLYGMPFMADEINAVANKYNIPVLEDSAEALGSTYKGKKCGTLTSLGVLSFNGNKIITTSGGGALITDSKEIKEKAVFIACQARDEAPHYQHSEIGHNYRMSNVLAGIGRGQMEVLPERVAARRANYDFYVKELSDSKQVNFLDEPKGLRSNRWLSCIVLPNFEVREKIRIALLKENIESRPLWKPMHEQPVFKKSPNYLNGVSSELFKKGLCLPSGSNLNREDLIRITNIIKNNLHQ
ncbi:aminotransferase class I/II-fold pyridoxal phosphate-dependent enzyme [Croceivirga sp. JEA036]|uniref:aminotransferase class I/II-fold pyridoxal phosphate-dependent enzyme n=1 Tax=Croceivirga sp. JEA036 TaxID=2721162 RepID=UPI00143B7286|nr:aminotransferase class I/II-fold pyridoxal phosphate-dependent enzyme [Croceivirga sp. JEA036]NJB35372.1 pyridoxal phosphate-dependent aminotransferase [Croceivirga sp. JEA036]